jgi:hypothetical protein
MTGDEAKARERCCVCGELVAEVCPDLVCRACHKSLSFDDCVSGEWRRSVRASAGLPPSGEEGGHE